ncbi:MAG TPA: hypothetical protein VHK27_12690 [Gammaproteobacteria bacterium]|nr:hypothetical protein [Gammaproteobacteria bacterium]
MWFYDGKVWHKIAYANFAVCGKVDPRKGPWVKNPPGIVCADCAD